MELIFLPFLVIPFTKLVCTKILAKRCRVVRLNHCNMFGRAYYYLPFILFEIKLHKNISILLFFNKNITLLFLRMINILLCFT